MRKKDGMETHNNNLFLEIIQEPKPRCALLGPTHERDQKWQTNQFNHSDQQTLHHGQTSPPFPSPKQLPPPAWIPSNLCEQKKQVSPPRPYCSGPQTIWHPLPTNDLTSISWRQSKRNIPRQLANHNRGIKLAIQIELNLGHLLIPRRDSKTV